MKKLLLVLIACCILAAPVLAVDEELVNLSDQQLLSVYDAILAEVQRRSLNTSGQTQRDPSIIFGTNIHVIPGERTLCVTPTPDYSSGQTVQLPILPTATPIASTGDKASFDSMDPSDLNGSVHVSKGQVFDVTWYLLNTGTTTWTTDYSLRFWSGTNFTKPGKNRYYLNNPVAPNTVGACSVDVVAPDKSGDFAMAMVLGNENDENFFIVSINITVD